MKNVYLNFFRRSASDERISVLFWVTFFIVIFIRVWLVNSQKLSAIGGAVYDDRLFLDIAGHFLKGDWLGPYDHKTLAKGPFYSIWIAMVFKSGIPLLLAQHLLYSAACCVFIAAIRPLVKNRLLLLAGFIILLFNPMSYTNVVMTQVLREGIYPALTITTISFAVGLLIRHGGSPRVLIPWAAGLGISLTAFWLTREEGVWIAPMLLVIVGWAVFMELRCRPVDFRKIGLYVLPFVIWLAAIGSVAGINKINYGIFATTEFKMPAFLKAYGALSRVKHADWKPAIPVPLDVRNRIYEASPAFSELKSFMEGERGKIWRNWIDSFRELYRKDAGIAKKMMTYLEKDPSGVWLDVFFNYKSDIIGGWFMWAFREAVVAAGYHSSGEAAANYYERLAKEVNLACTGKRLECEEKRATMMPVWHSAYLSPLLKSLMGGVVYFVRFSDFEIESSPSQGDEKSLKLFRDMTRERLAPLVFQIKGWAFSPGSDLHITVKSADGSFISPVLFLESEDVYQNFLAQGKDFTSAKKSRFDMLDTVTGDFSACKNKCYMQIEDNKQLRLQIPLDGSVKSIDTDEVRLNFEILNVLQDDLSKGDKYKLKILKQIGFIYHYAIPFLTVAALIAYIIFTIKLMKRQASSILWVLSTSLLFTIVIRLVMLSVINISSFPAMTVQYFSPLYPLFLMFIIILPWRYKHNKRLPI